MARYSTYLMVLVLLAGCAPSPTLPPTAPAAPSETARARELAALGNWQGAAEEYLRLADAAKGSRRIDLRLAAAGALVEAGDVDGAQQLLDATATEVSTDAQKIGVDIVQARISLARNRPNEALALLQGPVSPALPAALRVELHRTRARAYVRSGNYLAAARERVNLDALLDDPQSVKANQEAIWRDLAAVPEPALQSVPGAPPDVYLGWVDLALLARTHHGDTPGLEAAISAWRQRYPSHPVRQDLLTWLMSWQPGTMAHPARVALLLPISSQYAGAAGAVRDGFVAAYYSTDTTGLRPRLSIYDTPPGTIEAVYGQAVQDGAEFVVGPLPKDDVTALASSGTLTVPTLALNYGEQATLAPENLYQFGLSPEDEARQVADRAWLDGHVRALALVPEGAWGERVFGAFAEYWGQLGGQVVELQYYNRSEQNLSEPISKLLNVDESKSRHKRLQSTLKRKLEFEPRRRRDAEFVFMVAVPREARRIRPELKFFGATRLPVYATSHVYSGSLNPSADLDMDGVVFGDMPWVLGAEGSDASLRAAVTRYWPERAATYTRFYALGVDAYNVIPYLARLRHYPYERFAGETGRLRLDHGQRLHRELIWARFEGGIPRLLEPKTEPTPETGPEPEPSVAP